MSRHLLALLALLSGLAALGSPAHASSTGPLAASNICASAEAAENRAHLPAKRLDAPDKAARRCRETRYGFPVVHPHLLRKPVLMGVERALE